MYSCKQVNTCGDELFFCRSLKVDLSSSEFVSSKAKQTQFTSTDAEPRYSHEIPDLNYHTIRGINILTAQHIVCC